MEIDTRDVCMECGEWSRILIIAVDTIDNTKGYMCCKCITNIGINK